MASKPPPPFGVIPPGPLDLSEWISFAEAARRLPSPRAGRKTALSTIYRLAKRHKLTVLRRGCWRYVRWGDLLKLFEPEQQPEIQKRARGKARAPGWVDEELRRLGFKI